MKLRGASGASRSGRVGAVGLAPGQTVRGRVISQTGENRFRITAAGYFFDAASELPLEPGQKLLARVELGQTQLFLRIIGDENERSEDAAVDDPAEVRRVLEGLGLHPDDLEISEFQQRLRRYARHGGSRQGEPSDVWALAILWSRGIRGGADNFALLSYYLRDLIPEASPKTPLLPGKDLLDRLAEIHRESETAPTPTADPPPAASSPDQFALARQREAEQLLCRDSSSFGLYRQLTSHTPGFVQTIHLSGCSHFRGADHPVSPGWLLEAAQSGGRIKTRWSYTTEDAASIDPRVAAWTQGFRSVLRQSELDWDDEGIVEVDNSEALRFRFWRKWEADAVKSVSA
ncbi:MAG: hypothetical protein NTW14_08595 [bacterium]|nr:hypothetical protein [bacterium]